MKTLKNIKATVTGNKVTITADITEEIFRFPVQQVTVAYASDKNRMHIRHVQLSHEAIFIKRLSDGVAIPTEELIENVANQIEPKLSFPPIYKKSLTPLRVEFDSELDPKLQWMVSKDGKEWTAIPGQTSNQLDPKSVDAGALVCCVATSEAGSCTTPVMKV